MGKIGNTWRSVETSETDQGVTVPPSRGANRLPTWEHTWLTGVSAVEVGDEGWVQDVSGRDPAPLLWAITLPVNQVLENPAPQSNTQDASHLVRWMALDYTGWRSGLGNKRQRAVR